MPGSALFMTFGNIVKNRKAVFSEKSRYSLSANHVKSPRSLAAIRGLEPSERIKHDERNITKYIVEVFIICHS